MALYEYRCAECESLFEVMRPMQAADAPAECPGCGGRNARRQFSAFATFSTGSSSLPYAGPGTGESLNGGGGCCGGACGCSH